MRLIRPVGYQAFPPRLSHQPLFYPALNVEYAEQIARDWNTQNEQSGYMGAVTGFAVEAAYLAQFEEKTVGASIHHELWISAAELRAFNQHLRGTIQVLCVFYGECFSGERE